jgi:tetratricopeptide (TPR) repeat protein
MNSTGRALAAVFFLAVFTAAVESNAGSDGQRQPLGNNPNPVIWGGQSKPATPPKQPPPKQPPPKKPPEHGDHDGPHRDRPRVYYYLGGYYSQGGDTLVYDPCYVYNYAYPYLPPVYAPADDLFGPRALQRFMGGDDAPQPQPAARDQRPADPPEPKKGADRATNPRATALAQRFIGFGDALFTKQEYADANSRYRKATQSAPQLAEAWFRQGFALSAIGRYDQAVVAIKRGLKISPSWAKSGFRLEELYGADEVVRNDCLELLAEATKDRPNDANVLFLVGVHLHFFGQPARAQKFFQRAQALATGDNEHIMAFLAVVQE